MCVHVREERERESRGSGRERSILPTEQGSQCRTRSQDPGIMIWAEGRCLTNWAIQAPSLLTFVVDSFKSKLENLKFVFYEVICTTKATVFSFWLKNNCKCKRQWKIRSTGFCILFLSLNYFFKMMYIYSFNFSEYLFLVCKIYILPKFPSLSYLYWIW